MNTQTQGIKNAQKLSHYFEEFAQAKTDAQNENWSKETRRIAAQYAEDMKMYLASQLL